MRWQQRFANFCRALQQLELFFELGRTCRSDLRLQGLAEAEGS